LPLTSGQFIKVTEMRHENTTKIDVARVCEASEAEIWTSVRRRYLTSFAGLHFENEPGLTELDATEGRRNRWLYLKGAMKTAETL